MIQNNFDTILQKIYIFVYMKYLSKAKKVNSNIVFIFL